MEQKILVVDDELDVCEAIRNYLMRRGYKIVIATSTQEAITKLLSEKPVLILLDILMPGIDGIECLRRIRDLDKNVPVIMVTCVIDVDTANEALRLGAVDYITKPISFNELETLVSVRLSLLNGVR